MNTDQPTPDDSYRKAWQRAFDEAAETPPPRVWSAVERQLDADNRARVIPLWATVRPWVTGIAAAVAFVLAGWWTWQSLTPEANIAPPVAHRPTATDNSVPQNGEKIASKRVPSPQVSPTGAERIARRRPGGRVRPSQPFDEIAAVKKSDSKTLVPSGPATGREIKLGAAVGDTLLAGTTYGKLPTTGIDAPDRENAGHLDTAATLAQQIPLANPTALVARTPKPDAVEMPTLLRSEATVNRPARAELLPDSSRVTGTGLVATEQTAVGVPPLTRPAQTDGSERLVSSMERLAGKSFRSRELTIQRVVWFRNDEPFRVEPEEVKPIGREKWASVSVMPLSFNPVLNLQLASQYQSVGLNISNAYNFSASRVSTKTPSLRSESGGAVLVQASAGTQLSDRWSVETGIGYLQAQSTVQGPAQLTASNFNADADQTLYTAVVRDAINRNEPSTGVLDFVNVNANKSYDVQTALYSYQGTGRTRSDYSFVQVPVQMGFQLRPRRKLGLSVLGGLITNWFVRNRVGETLVVKPSDDVYRSVTLAGTAGARFRYRSSRRWSASLAGVFQQSLQLVTPTDLSLQVRPRTVGASFGVDYHF